MNVGVSLLTMVPGRAGGSETYVRGLLDAFARGFGPETSTVLVSEASETPTKPFAGSAVEVVRVNSFRPGASDISRLLAIGKATLPAGRITSEIPGDLDLMHFPVTVPIPPSKHLPRVVTLHDVQHRDLPHLFSRAERLFRRWAYDSAARGADEVITITDFSANRIADTLGIPRDRIHTIPLGVDHRRFKPDGPASTIAGLPRKYVYYPANAWAHKNHDRLIEALRLIGDEDLYLVLTGAGQVPLKGDAEQRIIRLGRVPDAELPGLYRGARALVFPSLYEGFGLPPLEAMACGCPVAASDAAAIGEVCGDSYLPFAATDTHAMAEAISLLTTDESLRSDLSRAGINHAAGFTWQAAAERHAEVYECAVERRR